VRGRVGRRGCGVRAGDAVADEPEPDERGHLVPVAADGPLHGVQPDDVVIGQAIEQVAVAATG
jgi:hypothetical protein